jgi:UDP-glucose 4-epimerase
MRIAVTGGHGFIGGATVRAAKEDGHDAWSFDHADGHNVLGSLAALEGADVVIHLAGMLGTAELFDSPHRAVEANITGTLNILQWCERNGAGIVQILMPDSDWKNVYQATKICAARLGSAWHRSRGVPVSSVRAFNAYGPGQKHGPTHPQKILPTFATEAWAGRPIPIWGDGDQSVDLIHVDDIARMLVDATRFGNDEVFDAGTGTAISVQSVAEMVNFYTGQPTSNIKHLPMRPGEEPHTHICASGEGWDKLSWRPEHDWDQVRAVVEWYRPELDPAQ